MRIVSNYSKRIKGYNHIFDETVAIYRAVVDSLIAVCLAEWNDISVIKTQIAKQSFVESLIHVTSKRPTVKYADFDTRYYKLPSYIRRAAISHALGRVSSYMSNLANWQSADPADRGKRPSVPNAGFDYPCLFRDGAYKEDGTYSAQIKVYIRNTWDWLTVIFRKSDVDYINRHCKGLKESAPTLRRRGKLWYLDFAYTEDVVLPDVKSASNTTIASVDLGINNAATISIMRQDGTIVAREFLSLAAETDFLKHAIGRVKKAQSHGARRTPRLWAAAKGINDDIAVKTAQFIVDTAKQYGADIIVMEHLNMHGKKRGSKKQRLHLWKVQYVQKMVTDKAHKVGIRISHVSSYRTSSLAFDGSGTVKRGKQSQKTDGNYSLCEFTTGKVYHCDLNATYNIGARYYIREILKALPATARLQAEAKVPSVCKRSTCTLSTLINLNAVLSA